MANNVFAPAPQQLVTDYSTGNLGFARSGSPGVFLSSPNISLYAGHYAMYYLLRSVFNSTSVSYHLTYLVMKYLN